MFQQIKKVIPCSLCQDPETLSIMSFHVHCPASPSSSFHLPIKSAPKATLGKIVLSSNTQTHTEAFALEKKPEGGNSSLGYLSLMIRQWDFSSHTGCDYWRGRLRYSNKNGMGQKMNFWAGDHCGVLCENCGVRKWENNIWNWGYWWEDDNNVVVLHTVASGCRGHIARAVNAVISTRLHSYSWKERAMTASNWESRALQRWRCNCSSLIGHKPSFSQRSEEVHCNRAGAERKRRSAGCTFSTLTPTFL